MGNEQSTQMRRENISTDQGWARDPDQGQFSPMLPKGNTEEMEPKPRTRVSDEQRSLPGRSRSRSPQRSLNDHYSPQSSLTIRDFVRDREALERRKRSEGGLSPANSYRRRDDDRKSDFYRPWHNTRGDDFYRPRDDDQDGDFPRPAERKQFSGDSWKPEKTKSHTETAKVKSSNLTWANPQYQANIPEYPTSNTEPVKLNPSNLRWVIPQRQAELAEKRSLNSQKQHTAPDPVSFRKSSESHFDYTKVPKGPKGLKTAVNDLGEEIDKTSPHIFIPASSVPPLPSTLQHMYNKFRSCSPKNVQQDSSGYYVHFATPAGVRQCFIQFDQSLLFTYQMQMQQFPFGQNETNAVVDLEHTENQNQTSISIYEDALPGAENADLEMEALPQSSQTRVNEARVCTPVTTQVSQSQDDSGSANGARTSSESSSASQSRKCHICRKGSPLDKISLITCPSCRRKYHKGCHKSSNAVFDQHWRCFYCKKAHQTTSPSKPDVASISLRRANDDTAQQPTGRLTCLNQSAAADAAPEVVPLSGSNRDRVRPLNPCENNKDNRKVLETPDRTLPISASSSHKFNNDSITRPIQLEKPDLSYRCLAGMPLLEAQGRQLSTIEIFAWLSGKGTEGSQEWQNGIQHALLTGSTGRDAIFEVHGYNQDTPEQALWSLRSAERPPSASENVPIDNDRVTTSSPSGDAFKAHAQSINDKSPSDLDGLLIGPAKTSVLSQTKRKFKQGGPDGDGRLIEELASKNEDMATVSPAHSEIGLAKLPQTSNTIEKEPRFTVKSLYDEDPKYRKKQSHEDKMQEIRARPTRKQIFGKQGVSRLKGHDASTRLTNLKLGLQRVEDRNKPSIQKSESEGLDLMEIDPKPLTEEVEPEEFASLEELLGLPRVVMPTVSDNQMAFVDRTQTQGGRLRRAKLVYKFGSNQ